MHVLTFFLSKKHSILPKYIKPAPRSSSSCWGAPLYPTPIITNLSTPRPPIVTNLSTPCSSSPSCPPQAHCHQPINPMLIVTILSTPGPLSPTYQPHAHRHHPVHPRPIVTNLSTPCSSSPSCPPQAHCH